jgi:hypothetical protein
MLGVRGHNRRNLISFESGIRNRNQMFAAIDLLVKDRPPPTSTRSPNVEKHDVRMRHRYKETRLCGHRPRT